jgi:hypothetical protein
MERYLQKELLIDEIFNCIINNVYDYTPNFNKLNNYLIELQNDENNYNFLPVLHYMKAIIFEITEYMKDLDDTNYDTWEALDLLIYKLENMVSLINRTLYTATDLSKMFQSLEVTNVMDTDNSLETNYNHDADDEMDMELHAIFNTNNDVVMI